MLNYHNVTEIPTFSQQDRIFFRNDSFLFIANRSNFVSDIDCAIELISLDLVFTFQIRPFKHRILPLESIVETVVIV